MNRSFDSGADRLRSGQACLLCRKRKNKCDGAKPACGFCAKRNLQCDYRAPKPASIARDYVNTLEARVRRLEQELRQSNAQSQGHASLTPTTEVSSDASLVQEFEQHSLHLGAIPPEASSLQSAVTDFGLAPPGMSATQSSLPSEHLPEDSSPEVIPSIASREAAPVGSEQYILPPLRLANRLVELFFAQAAPLLPFVHERTFRRRLHEVYSDKKRATISFLSVLNITFAYGCDYLDLDLNRTYELAQAFHRRAADLVFSVCYDCHTLEVVQALLLVTLHLNSNMQFSRMWVNTGLLVRTAQALRLHLDPSNWKISRVEKALRKQLWWSTYALDRFLSLKYFRPPALSVGAHFATPHMSCEDEQVCERGLSDSPEAHVRGQLTHYFNALTQLIDISERVLMSANRDSPWSRARSPKLGTVQDTHSDITWLYSQQSLVADQEGRLSAWSEGLPEHLQFNHVNTDLRLKKQQRTLEVRYLHARLMIHRQTIILAMRHGLQHIGNGDRFLLNIVTASMDQCIECACALVRLVDKYSSQQSLGPWWMNVQFLFTALSALYAVTSKASVMPSIDEVAVNETINTAMNLLHSIGDVCPTLSKCREHFESLQMRARDHGPSYNSAEPNADTVLSAGSEGEDQLGGQDVLRPRENPDDEFYTLDMDQTMAESSNLFLGPLLDDFSYGQFEQHY